MAAPYTGIRICTLLKYTPLSYNLGEAVILKELYPKVLYYRERPLIPISWEMLGRIQHPSPSSTSVTQFTNFGYFIANEYRGITFTHKLLKPNPELNC